MSRARSRNPQATETDDTAEKAISATTSRACSRTRRVPPGPRASAVVRMTLGAVGGRLIGSTPLDGAWTECWLLVWERDSPSQVPARSRWSGPSWGWPRTRCGKGRLEPGKVPQMTRERARDLAVRIPPCVLVFVVGLL